jgi:dTDP-4-dehydrorhamnose 3,5-epimerase
MIKVYKTKFKGLLILKGKKYKDNRGYLREMLREEKIGEKFKFQILSKSKKNVLRGLHFQLKKPQAKHISVIKGQILDVAVDLRKKSKTFGKSYSVLLTEKNCKSVFIPKGFAHGFLTLGHENIVCYSCTEYRSVGNEYSLSYKDPFLKIKWPKVKLVTTKKDALAKNLIELINDKII